MHQDTLTKIYYKNESDYLNEYQRRYNAPFTTHLDILIKQYNHNNAYPAFFYYTEEIALLIEHIYKTYEDFLYLRHSVPPVVLHQFSLLSILEEVKSTNDIEGVHSTKKEIRAIIDGAAPQNAHSASVVNKYHSLLTNTIIKFETSQDIRDFYEDFAHKEIIAENSNNALDGDIFRRNPVDIESTAGKIIHRGITPEAKIIEAMEYALSILHNQRFPFLIRISIFHYLFAYIHPFYDGNGRTDRFITAYYLSKHFNNLAALRLSVLIKKNRKKYYALFAETDSELNRADMTPFIKGFLQLLLDTFKDTIAILERKNAQLEEYKDKIKKFSNNDHLTDTMYYILLQAALFYGQGISMAGLVNITNKSKGTIKARLDSIPRERLIVSTSNRTKYYKLNLLIFK